MKLKVTFVIAGLVALAIPFAANAGSSVDRVTGGGQVAIGTRGGAGDTITFTAQDFATKENKGQVQYVDRTPTGQTTYHGIVKCVRADGDTAKLAGVWRKGPGTTFQIYVVDNGEGFLADSDVVTMQNGQPNDCDPEDNDDDGQVELARGNAQVYDADQ